MTPRVFVISEPLRRDGERWVRTMDLTPAAAHGELVFLMPPGNEGPADPRACVSMLEDRLASFTPSDFLLPVGHPLYIAWAAAIACRRAGGRLNLLHWQPGLRRYNVVRSVLPAYARGETIESELEDTDG